MGAGSWGEQKDKVWNPPPETKAEAKDRAPAWAHCLAVWQRVFFILPIRHRWQVHVMV